MRFPRPCIMCNKLHRDSGDYCSTCRIEVNRKREANPERRAKKRLLYNANYQASRKAMIQETLERNLPCHLCNQPFFSVSEITADHLLAGNSNSPLAPAHRSCNSSRGSKPINS